MQRSRHNTFKSNSPKIGAMWDVGIYTHFAVNDKHKWSFFIQQITAEKKLNKYVSDVEHRFCQTSQIEKPLGAQKNIWNLAALDSQNTLLNKEQFQTTPLPLSPPFSKGPEKLAVSLITVLSWFFF